MNKRIIYGVLLLLISGTSCSKIEDPVLVEKQVNRETLIAVSHPVYGVDSLYYKNNLLTQISGYKYKGSNLLPDISYKVVQNTGKIEISSKNAASSEVNTFYFKDSLLTEISGPGSNLKAYFHYKDGMLSYFTYSGYDYEKNACAGTAKDSLRVFYDTEGKNISELKWYRKDDAGKPYDLVYSTLYTFDEKLSPYKSSVYSLARKWKGADDIIVYFNTNNIVTTGSHMFYYTYNENMHPVSMEFAVYGKTDFYYIPD
jgi:hypothetical protein